MQKKSLETILYSTIGVAAMALILVGVNVITSAARQRVDLTKEKAYTLSQGTRAILNKLDTPVKIRFYFTQSKVSTPETVFLKKYARSVEDLLAEYKQASKGKIIVEKYDPQPDSDAEDSARLDGIEFPAVAPELTDLGQRHPVVQKIRHRNLSGLNFRIRKLHAERYSQAAPLGRVGRAFNVLRGHSLLPARCEST